MKATILYFLFFSLFSYSQDGAPLKLYNAIDSYPDSVLTIALSEVDKQKAPETIADYYYLIALAYNQINDWENSFSFLEKLDSLVDNQPPTTQRQLELAILRSKNYYGLGRLILADQVLSENQSLFKAVDDYKVKAKYLLHKGWLAREQGKHGSALETYLEAQRIIEANNDDRLLAECFSKIAVVYHVIGDYNTAEQYYDKTLKMYQRLGMIQAEARLYNNYGLLYQYQNIPTKAALYFEKSIEMCTENNNIRGVAIANENIGMLWFENLDNNAMALRQYEKSLAIWRETNDIYGQAQTLVNIMYVHNDNKDFKKTIITGNEALIYTLESGAKDVERDLYKELSIAYEGLKQSSEAFSYYKKHTQLKDSLKSLNEFDEIKTISLRLELEKKNLQDSLTMVLQYEQGVAATDATIKQQRFWTGLMSVGSVGLATIVFLLFRNRKQRQKSAEAIEVTNKKLTSKNAEIIDSINYAKHIQSTILPSVEEINSLLNECSILYLPKDIVAGDFYWLTETKTSEGNSKVFFAVADCTGHGVPGAMVSIVCSAALNKAVNELNLFSPAEILEEVTNIVVDAFEKGKNTVNDGMDISLISIEKRKDNTIIVEFSGANNPLWFIRQSNGLIEEKKGTKRPVGRYGLPLNFETSTFTFVPGDSLYLFSDGFPDQFGGPKNKKFKYQTLKVLFEELNPLPTDLQIIKMEETLIQWSGINEQIDDVCVAVIKL
ncbi:MAG: tetratricopeptide repeat protein [Crocinitomix sp.]|nr:tetratricopeptide repeat protein [Crocinitomix sp.]